ncbi:MAG: hypothetical protein H8E28_00215 [Anaerolineae bacterium]|nr:hypothetical protein [Anaerolineae bacterium]
MASKIKAINAYRPRLSLSDAANEDRYMELITQRTTLSAGVVKNVQESEVETLIGLLLDGRPVHTGIAIYTPSIDLDGDLEVKVKVDKRVLRALNAAGAFRGHLINAENIGKTSDDLVAMWNEAHPEDPVG